MSEIYFGNGRRENNVNCNIKCNKEKKVKQITKISCEV